MEVYHRGNLMFDREYDPDLNKLAEDYLERGTAAGRLIYPERGIDSVRGRGEGYLTQKRLWSNVFEYRFTPKRRDRNE